MIQRKDDQTWINKNKKIAKKNYYQLQKFSKDETRINTVSFVTKEQSN